MQQLALLLTGFTRLADRGPLRGVRVLVGTSEAWEVLAVTVSMRVMHAGDGYKYLLRSVAAGDGNRTLATPLTRYYVDAGTPPGRWMGSGLSAIGGGRSDSRAFRAGSM